MSFEIQVGVYRHKKGKLYKVLHCSLDSNDCKKSPMVNYMQLEDGDFPIGTIWHRELDEFKRSFTLVENFEAEKGEIIFHDVYKENPPINIIKDSHA